MVGCNSGRWGDVRRGTQQGIRGRLIRSLSVESGVPHTMSSWQALFQIIAHQINLKFFQDEKRGIAGGSPAGIPYENPSHDESLEPSTIRDAQKGEL